MKRLAIVPILTFLVAAALVAQSPASGSSSTSPTSSTAVPGSKSPSSTQATTPSSSPTATPSTTPSATPSSPAQASKPSGSTAPAASSAAKPQLTKDETVYAVLDPSGNVKSIIVSDWLHSEKPGIEIKDKSSLTDIENVKGYEKPRRVGDALIWKLDGNDLYYRGKSSKPLPLTVNIRYWLDGKPIDPKQLSGKSGTVRVRVEVRNLAAADRIIDGTKRRIYAPMIVVVGLQLPIVGFRDLQVSNGTILTDGQSNIAAGILVPGLKESIVAAGSFGTSLDLSGFGIKDVPLPDAFEFSAKADRFKMGSIYIAATPDFPELGGPNTVKALDDALLGFQQLADASKAIKEGSAALAQGTATLRAGISQALTAVRPFLAEAKPGLEKLSLFLNDEKNIAAARELLGSGGSLDASLPLLSDVLAKSSDPETARHLKAAMDAASKVQLDDLLGIPGAASIVSEDSLAAIGDFLVAGDDLYKAMDEKRLQAAAEFAVGSAAVFDAISAYDELLKSYDPANGASLQALGAKAAEYDLAARNLAAKPGFDAAAAAASLKERATAEANFVAATSFLSDSSAVSALQAKLASGAALSDSERANLSRLLGAATTERASARTSQAGQVADVLPALGDSARLAPQAAQAAQAAQAMSAKVLPGLAAAKAAVPKTDQAIQAARKILNPQMTNVISTTVSKVFAMRRAYDKNKNTLQATRSFLAVRLKSGSFKAQIDAIDTIQKELKALEPFFKSVQTAIGSEDLKSLAGLSDKDSSTPSLADYLADFEQLKPLLTMGQDVLSGDSLQKYRTILAKLPEAESLLNDFDDGSALLAVKMSELAAGTKQFDEQGIQAIATQIVDKAQIIRGFLKVKDELTALSRDYQSFSGAPDGADTTLKFIFKTDEIR